MDQRSEQQQQEDDWHLQFTPFRILNANLPTATTDDPVVALALTIPDGYLPLVGGVLLSGPSIVLASFPRQRGKDSVDVSLFGASPSRSPPWRRQTVVTDESVESSQTAATEARWEWVVVIERAAVAAPVTAEVRIVTIAAEWSYTVEDDNESGGGGGDGETFYNRYEILVSSRSSATLLKAAGKEPVDPYSPAASATDIEKVGTGASPLAEVRSSSAESLSGAGHLFTLVGGGFSSSAPVRSVDTQREAVWIVKGEAEDDQLASVSVGLRAWHRAERTAGRERATSVSVQLKDAGKWKVALGGGLPQYGGVMAFDFGASPHSPSAAAILHQHTHYYTSMSSSGHGHSAMSMKAPPFLWHALRRAATEEQRMANIRQFCRNTKKTAGASATRPVTPPPTRSGVEAATSRRPSTPTTSATAKKRPQWV